MAATMMFMAATDIKAESIDYSNISVDYNFNLSMKAMDKAMILTMEQVDFLERETYKLNRRVRKLHKAKPEERAEKLNALLTQNLLQVYPMMLDGDQYRAYLRVLNTEINRTGLNVVLATMDLADVDVK